MRRAFLAIAFVIGLGLGTAVPGSALIGDTAVTINCSDGTSVNVVVDADTLTGLTQGIQAMIDYPAGLTCTLVQNPLGALFGRVALASPGQSPFIVGGGRWQATCDSLGLGSPGGALPGMVIARVPGSWSSGEGLRDLTATGGANLGFAWVNIAVNFHQRDGGTFFGTLNETIPSNQPCPGGMTSESHFTSKPDGSPTGTGCFSTDPFDPSRAYVRSYVTQTSGVPFPRAALNTDITFTFKDNGNPSRTTDKLQGPPEVELSDCELRTGTDPGFDLLNGNISLH